MRTANPSSTATAAKVSPAMTAGRSGSFLVCMLRDEGGAVSPSDPLAKLCVASTDSPSFTTLPVTSK